MVTLQEAADLVNFATASDPKAVVTEAMIDQWQVLLSDLPLAECKAAVVFCLRTKSGWVPRPFDIREALTLAKVAPNLDPMQAWGEVLREVQRVGLNPRPRRVGGKVFPPLQPEFSSPLIAATVEAIGWRALCTFELKDESIIRSQFMKALQGGVAAARQRSQAGTFEGLEAVLAAGPTNALPERHTHDQAATGSPALADPAATRPHRAAGPPRRG